MKIFFKPTSNLLTLFLFLPITPSIAAITVFTQSVFTDWNEEVSIAPQHSKRVSKASEINI